MNRLITIVTNILHTLFSKHTVCGMQRASMYN